jgi:hypothetical protein
MSTNRMESARDRAWFTCAEIVSAGASVTHLDDLEEEAEQVASRVKAHPELFGPPSAKHVEDVRRHIEHLTGKPSPDGLAAHIAKLVEVALALKTLQVAAARRRAAPW